VGYPPKVEHHAGELFPRLGFIVTNTQLANRKVVHFYNQRGKAKQWIKEGKQAVIMTRLSCPRFRGNDVRLWLSILACNLGNLWRRPALPAGISDWSMTSLQQRLVKTGGRLVKHARYYWLMLAEGHPTRVPCSVMLRRIALLPLPANLPTDRNTVNPNHGGQRRMDRCRRNGPGGRSMRRAKRGWPRIARISCRRRWFFPRSCFFRLAICLKSDRITSDRKKREIPALCQWARFEVNLTERRESYDSS
jgi:hypothetical protein